MHRSYVFLLAMLAFSFAAAAQSGTGFGFEFRPAAAVVHGADTLRNAWTGGLNTPQFSTLDLNDDGQDDLFAFDRETSRAYTFLSVAAPGTAAGRRWAYAPQYESLFPADLQGWALLRDYDCDSRPDLFTYFNNGEIRVFRNVLANGRPSFQLTTNQIRFFGGFTGTANLTLGGYNMPAIQDVNGDGKLDIMSYDFVSASFIELYLNTSPGTCGNALTFTLKTDNWGGIQTCHDCASYKFNGQPCFTARPLHTGGHSLLLVDLDGDGDQDLLDGRDNCPELVSLLNQGTALAPVLTQASVSASFPSAATPVRVPVFPSGYYFDANFDSRPDLVVAPNMFTNLEDQVSLRNNVQLFENTAASGAPALAYRAAGFLANEVIDVSEGAAPTFGDLDGDGLPDMLIGNHADRVGGVYRANLTQYRNVGTRARPVFSFVTADYLGLAAQRLLGLKPVLVDLNRDGALDLAYSAWNGSTNSLYYILNTAAGGQPVAFSTATAVAFKPQGAAGTGVLPHALGDVPSFADVDNDGYVDLLIGTNETREAGMSLRYFRNRGRGPLDSAFVLVDNDFGRIRTASGSRPANLSPTVADFDGDGLPDLLTVDAAGVLRFFPNYRAQSILFSERTDLLHNPLTGQYEPTRLGQSANARYALAAADLNGDGAPELLVGTQAGGLLSYGTRNRTITPTRGEAARTLALTIYPNPATASVTVETAAPTRLTVLDLTGRVVQTGAQAQRRHLLNLSGLTPGVYLVRATGTNGSAAVQRLLVR
ncbi:T9SS type A sorting domain-containing protein [Hymenobacter sp. BT683]|uniref:T9SS type A sorting domain-containing protein n=1 Tax=Hymenobacter jeongseonensis TaxID=2791027 RepID=A0ABS0ID98_9BACT|nr:T9SS type A sorting domain-containing protein [Hymenobacter jeongseonensis]MBF9236328.1 T9SS type A sorting domain-containing protein [Hymenobacter jeongseonensis]